MPAQAGSASPELLRVYERIYAHVKTINGQVEQLPCLREESRKLYRFIKRVEVLVSDLQPYISQDPSSLAALQDVEAALLFVLGILVNVGAKGPVAGYMEADRMLASYKAASDALDKAIGSLPLSPLAIADETASEVDRLRGMLQRAKYELPFEHQQSLKHFRDACDQLTVPFETMQGACSTIIKAVTGEKQLTREGFATAIGELQEECEQVAKTPHAGDEYYLRMMMDMVRIQHVQSETPLEYLCPLTLQIMVDPVVLVETGHSYGREAIAEWFRTGHLFCPRSGVKIKSLNVTPNQNLREAIKRWRLHSGMQLTFRPIIASITELQQEKVAAAIAKAATAAAAVNASTHPSAEASPRGDSAAVQPSPPPASHLGEQTSEEMVQIEPPVQRTRLIVSYNEPTNQFQERLPADTYVEGEAGASTSTPSPNSSSSVAALGAFQHLQSTGDGSTVNGNSNAQLSATPRQETSFHEVAGMAAPSELAVTPCEVAPATAAASKGEQVHCGEGQPAGTHTAVGAAEAAGALQDAGLSELASPPLPAPQPNAGGTEGADAELCNGMDITVPAAAGDQATSAPEATFDTTGLMAAPYGADVDDEQPDDGSLDLSEWPTGVVRTGNGSAAGRSSNEVEDLEGETDAHVHASSQWQQDAKRD